MELHTRLNVVSRGSKGRTCCGSAAYRAGENIRDTDGHLHRYSKKNGIVDGFLMFPENTPEELKNRSALWYAADMSEHRKEDGQWRKNPQLYRDWCAAIPNEIPNERCAELLKELIQPLVDEGMCADINVHDPEPKKGKERNKHVHVMLTLREMTENGFGKKNRDWNRNSLAGELRTRWAEICNRELQLMNSDKIAEHKSFSERGIARVPQKHEGPQRYYRERLQSKYSIKPSGIWQLNHSQLQVFSINKANDKLLIASLINFDIPWQKLSDQECKNFGLDDSDKTIFAVTLDDYKKINDMGQGFFAAGSERLARFRDRQRGIWQIQASEKMLVSNLREGRENKKASADAAWEEFRNAKTKKEQLYADKWASQEAKDFAKFQMSEAYKKAKNAGGEASRGIKAERILRNYRNFALGLAKDVDVPDAELKAASEAYENCIAMLSEHNNAKTRNRLTRALEVMREEAEKAAKKREKQSLKEAKKQKRKIRLQKFKKIFQKKVAQQPAKRKSLDEQIFGAKNRAGSPVTAKPTPEQEL